MKIERQTALDFHLPSSARMLKSGCSKDLPRIGVRMSRVRWSVVMVLVVLAAGFTPTAGATAPELCAPTPKVATSFCMQYAVTVTAPGTTTAEDHAAAPADIALQFANTSTNHASDTNVWLQQLTFSLLTGLGGKAYTPSASLPNNLLLSGASAACGPGADNSFSACTAGSGTFFANVSGLLEPGVHAGTFGVQRITNVNPPATGMDIDWSVAVEFCLQSSTFGACGFPQTETLQISAPAATSGGSITIPTTSSFSFDTESVDASLDSISLRINGQSNSLGDGTPTKSYSVLHLPATCGSTGIGAAFTDRASTVVSAPLALSVLGCPSASLTNTSSKPDQEAFNAKASTTGTSGRSIAKWQWNFGDGTRTTTTSPRATHVYKRSADRTVSLVVIDSLGAISPATTRKLHGTSLSLLAAHAAVKHGTKVILHGRLSRSTGHAALAGQVVEILRCTSARPAAHCARVKKLRTSNAKGARRGTFSLSFRPRKTATYRAVFAGGTSFISTTASKRIKVRR
jgi:hypothetical protein